MFAILETGSKQYKVEEGDVLEVELLDKDKISADNTLNFDRVLLVKDKDLHIGQPFVADACIQAKVLEELKGEKVIIFKKKAKKQYRRTRGHRQKLHFIQIEKIEIKPTEPAEPAEPAEDIDDASEKPGPAAVETKMESPTAIAEEVKTPTKEKKPTKTKTRSPKKKLPEKEEEKE
jgi:large subunit ribosomal protein L21